jgi:hypothetical protein
LVLLVDHRLQVVELFEFQFQEFRASICLDVIPREFPFSEGDESMGPGYSSSVNQPTTFQAISSKSPIDLSPHLLG